jgi:hypothetical protein
MPDSDNLVTVEVVSRLGEVPAADWDACAGVDNPFLSHAFLCALEDSGSATAETGWLPQHLVMRGPDRRLIGAMPLYLKNHSYGEYVFDWGWADAYERAGGDYYPKLQSSVPFTPVTGPRLLVRPGEDAAAVRAALISAVQQVTERHGIVTAHVTFPTDDDWAAFGAAGWLQRVGLQYHWHNRGYASFDEFLATLSSRKRKAIRKERREALAEDITIHMLTGDDLKEEHWDAFFRFYRNTSDRKWGMPYLTREFFHRIAEGMADRVLLVMGERDGRWMCGAFNLIGSDALYGRNWGAAGHFKFLHFEACYYRAIDFAIERGLDRVEAGAQGPHKVQRGYLPVETHSSHLIRDPALERAVARFVAEERRAVREEIAEIEELGPYRKTDCAP